MAIAAVEGAVTIYSDDEDIAKLADDRFNVIGIADIPLPPQTAQGLLPLVAKDSTDPEQQP